MVASPEKFQRMFIGLKDDIRLCIGVNDIVVQITGIVVQITV